MAAKPDGRPTLYPSSVNLAWATHRRIAGQEVDHCGSLTDRELALEFDSIRANTNDEVESSPQERVDHECRGDDHAQPQQGVWIGFPRRHRLPRNAMSLTPEHRSRTSGKPVESLNT